MERIRGKANQTLVWLRCYAEIDNATVISFVADPDQIDSNKTGVVPMSYRHVQKAAVAVALLTLTSCETIAPQEPTALKNSDHLVVPGDRIGPVALGMSPKSCVPTSGAAEHDDRISPLVAVWG